MEETKLIDWLRLHASKIIVGILCISALAFFLGRTGSTKKMSAQKDFVVIQRLFDQIQGGASLPLEAVEKAETILSHHPELHPKYDLLIALSFFQQEKNDKGILYTDALLKRAQKISSPSPYSHFGHISLLIATSDYAKALAQSQQLEETLHQQPALETLRAFNLLRIAFLAKELQDHILSKQAWDTLQSLPAFSQISPAFEEGTFTLKDYFSF